MVAPVCNKSARRTPASKSAELSVTTACHSSHSPSSERVSFSSSKLTMKSTLDLAIALWVLSPAEWLSADRRRALDSETLRLLTLRKLQEQQASADSVDQLVQSNRHPAEKLDETGDEGWRDVKGEGLGASNDLLKLPTCHHATASTSAKSPGNWW